MKMHWCTCKVNLSGQNFTVIVIDEHNPVSWPEAQILIALHGEENVFSIKPCRTSHDSSPSDEKRRLLGKYGPITERVFPGRVFRMEMMMPGEEAQYAEATSEGEPVPVSAAMDEEYVEPVADGPPAAAVFKPPKPGRPHPPVSGHL